MRVLFLHTLINTCSLSFSYIFEMILSFWDFSNCYKYYFLASFGFKDGMIHTTVNNKHVIYVILIDPSTNTNGWIVLYFNRLRSNEVKLLAPNPTNWWATNLELNLQPLMPNLLKVTDCKRFSFLQSSYIL